MHSTSSYWCSSSLTHLSFRKVSNHCRDLVDDIIYRSITLNRAALFSGKGTDEHWELTKRLSGRVLDTNDNLSRFVREITIDKWVSIKDNAIDEESMLLDAMTLERILLSIKNLHNFKPLNLQFEAGDICPPLQELKLPEKYRLDMQHCLTWRGCMNWSHLGTLNLGARCPENFLAALTGHVPNLKCLRFLLSEGKDPEKQCSNMSVVRKFLYAIDGLEGLYIQNCYENFEAVWPQYRRESSKRIAHMALRDALELFREVLRVNRKSELEELEIRAIKFKDGWFGDNYEDTDIAKVRRDESATRTDSVDSGLIGTFEEVELSA
ncbi:hypothetical protein G7Y89_g10575 [Cudoniella acicularis]|uniref:Uncharacterized protein n=1 Tax=Cudoniella acicularis TaxID=354080 RepID=A0A8H4VYW6_9HELO|nr:hypothetical protein G7Y89_g10575 [Cudoniella acicularis]